MKKNDDGKLYSVTKDEEDLPFVAPPGFELVPNNEPGFFDFTENN